MRSIALVYDCAEVHPVPIQISPYAHKFQIVRYDDLFYAHSNNRCFQSIPGELNDDKRHEVLKRQ